MAALPLVSICVANYNGIDIIDACLASVYAQDCDFPIEIIVHDDASSDGSAQHIKGHHPRVRLIESGENVGFCVANNRMATMARGKYLLLLNNDAMLFSDALAALLNEATRLGLPSILSLPQFDAKTGDLLDIGALLDLFLNSIPNKYPDRREVGMVAGACMWIPKSLWEELGGFPDQFGSIGEDLYLCCRARLAGRPVIAIGQSGFRHWVGHSFGGGKIARQRLSTNKRRRALSERNKTFVMVITTPLPLLLWLFPIHLVTLLLEGIAISLAKRDRTIFTTIYGPVVTALWRHRRELAELRRLAQRTRRISVWKWLLVFRPMPYKVSMLLRYGMPELR